MSDRQAGLQLIVALDSVNGCAGTTEAVAAAAAAHQLIACVFHSRHDGKLSGYGILFSIEIYVYHFLHVFYTVPFLVLRWKFINFVATEYGAVFADIFGADVAAAAFADTTFHTKHPGSCTPGSC